MKPFYHVAVGVVYDKQGNILLTQRAPEKHQGGKWEFAGGKVEPGETVQDALIREFYEELGIKPTKIAPLIKVPYHYPEHSVLLDVWEVFEFDGDPHPREGQAMQWVAPASLEHHDFPPANRAIIRAAQLPHYYLITPDQTMSLDDFKQNLERVFALGVSLCRVRQGKLTSDIYGMRVQAAIELAAGCGVKIIVDGPVQDTVAGFAGWHLNSKDLYHYQERPVSHDALLIASLHNEQDVIQANRLQVDCSVLSPLQLTSSHPDATSLGWARFAQLVAQADHPVYALGGLQLDDLLPIRASGGQGVAAISSLWELNKRLTF